ncbi:MAG: translation initiation factor IF-3 [Candidatus Kapabacteria bacterium]|nr:translation initiation factor IF-3 [Candidatus Kapabacteria bacterium]
MRRPSLPLQGPRVESQRKHKINDEIGAPEVRVLDSTNAPLGILPRREALRIAAERELDLVEIAPQANPPVCKIIDYGKFVYEQQKREKQAKKSQTQTSLKEVRFKAGTDTHDFDFKTRHARQFLTEGHKVKATVMFKGREILHKELGEVLLQRFIDALADVSKIDQPMKMEGRFLGVLLTPESKKTPKKKSESAPADGAETPSQAPAEAVAE